MSVEAGDLIGIPIDEHRMVAAIVMYVSSHFKNVILLGLTGKIIDGDLTSPPPILRYDYASQEAIQRGRWKLVKKGLIENIDPAISMRIVGGEVWIGDEEIRPATREEMRTLPRMGVAGTQLVERRAVAGIEPKD